MATMTTKPEALRLADRLEGRWALHPDMQEAAAELRHLKAENERLQEQCIALLEALKEITPSICHVSIVPEEKCAQCGRIARARAAIKAVEGGKK